MSTPLISIMVPVLNTRAWLPECLESLRNQSLTQLEVICVDNGSEDGSLELLREYASRDDRFKVLQCDRVGRLGGARNVGMRVARGKYIGFVDSDDYVDLAMFETMVNLAEKAEADVTVCNTRFFSEIDGTGGEAVPREVLKHDAAISILDSPRLLRNLTSTNKIYRKSFLDQLDLWFPEGFYHEDQYFTVIALFCAPKIATWAEPLYWYRKQRPGAIGTHRGKDNLHVFTVLADTETYLHRRGLDAGREAVFEELLVSRILALSNSIDGPLHRTYFETMKERFEGIEIAPPLMMVSPTEYREYRWIQHHGYRSRNLYTKCRTIYGAMRRMAGK